MEAWHRGYHGGAFRGGTLADAPGWPPTGEGPWAQLPGERWADFSEAVIDFPNQPHLGAEARSGLFKLFQARLRGLRDWRKTHVTFKPVPPDAALTNKLAQLWDGMRPLPYGLDQICAAITEAAYPNPDRPTAVAPGRLTATGGRWIEIEMSMVDGRPIKVVCHATKLQLALRPDLGAVLTEDRKDQRNLSTLLLWAFSPRKLFAFSPFAEAFATDVIPGQINAGTGGAIIFSPHSLHAFGNP